MGVVKSTKFLCKFYIFLSCAYAYEFASLGIKGKEENRKMSIFRRFFGVLTIAFCCVFVAHSARAITFDCGTAGGGLVYQVSNPTVNSCNCDDALNGMTEGSWHVSRCNCYTLPTQATSGCTAPSGYELKGWQVIDNVTGYRTGDSLWMFPAGEKIVLADGAVSSACFYESDPLYCIGRSLPNSTRFRALWTKVGKTFEMDVGVNSTMSGAQDMRTFEITIAAYGNYTIDWGDGTIQNYVTDNNDPQTFSHVYPATGVYTTYTIGLSGAARNKRTYVYSCDHPVIQFSSPEATNPPKIVGIRGSLGAIFNSSWVFRTSHFSDEAIYCSRAPSYQGLFKNQQITSSIPPELFVGSPSGIMPSQTGGNTSWPSGDGFSKIWWILNGEAFSPSRLPLPKYKDAFMGDDLGNGNITGSIPDYLFGNDLYTGSVGGDNYYVANMFEHTFYKTHLTGTIPATLFSGQNYDNGYIQAYPGMFKGTFEYGDFFGPIPENLFANINGNADDLYNSTFKSCIYLTGTAQGNVEALPAGLFRNSNNATGNRQFEKTFYGTALDGFIPPYLFHVRDSSHGTGSNVMNNIFSGSPYLDITCPNGYEEFNTGYRDLYWYDAAANGKVISCVPSTHTVYTFQLAPHNGSSTTTTIYEKYSEGWATSANASSWNMTNLSTIPNRTGYTLRGYYDHEVADVSSNSAPVSGIKIRKANNSNSYLLPDPPLEVPSSGTSETWHAAWVRNCAPTAPATCNLQIIQSGAVFYQTACPTGYSEVNANSYNPSCTAGFIDITLNNNGATSAGSTTLRARYGVGVYLDPDATMQMTTNSNPITKPQKQFTVNYNAQGGTMSGGNATSTSTATFTFLGYRDIDSVAVIGADGYITSAGITEGQSYTTGATWTARWSGGAVTLPNASRPGYTLAGWRTAGNCGGAFVGTPGQSYTPSGNVTLYACWTDVPYYTITLSDGSYNDITQHGYISSTGNNQCTTAGMKYGDGWLNICNTTPHVGDTLSLRQVPKRPNHVFAGYWGELAGGAAGVDRQVVTPTGEFLETDEVIHGFASNSTIVASWAPKYLITLNPYGGSGGDASVYEGYGIGWSKTQNGDYTETSITPPTRTGYTFTGFWSDPNAGVRYIRSNGTLPDPDSFNSARTLYAHWTPKTYTITLNDNGGSGGLVGNANANCNTAGLQYGTAWVNICEGSGSGSGGTVSDRGATGDRGATSDGESGKAEGASGESGGSEKATASSTGLSLYHIPERNGYMFNGYWTQMSGGDMIVAQNGNFLGSALTFTSQNRQIYAQWISGTPSNTIYTITLDPNNNGVDGGRPPKIYQKGGHFWADSTATTYQITGSVFDPISDGGAGITRPTPPSGKAFSGYVWDRMTEQFTDAEGIITHVPDFTANITVTAHWVNAATTTVTLNPNGGTACAVTSVTATQGQPMPTLTCGPAAPTGYDFTGYWNTQNSGYPQYYDSDLNSAFIWNQTGSSATIYAGYTPAERHIMYRCGSAFGAFSLSQAVTYGNQYTIANMADVGCNAVSGKKFIGWTDAVTGTFFEPGQTISNWPYYTDMTLDATYLDVYTVTLSSSGATNNPRPTVAYVIPYTPNSNGHEGWYSDSTGDTPITRMQTKPERPFYAFAGYSYQGTGETSGNTIDIIDSDGYFVYDTDVLRKITASGTATALWTPLAPEFSVVTTSLSANTTFRFYIGAAGSFMVNWGDGNTQVVSSPGVVSHTYSSAGARTIGIVGDATSYTNAYTTGTIYNTGRVAESAQWSNNTVRPIQLNFPAAIRFGCEAEDTSCTLTPQLISAVQGSLGDVFPTLGTGNTQQPRFSRTFAGCTSLTDVPENLFGGVYGSAIPGMFYGTFEDSGLVSVGQNLFSGITSFAPHAFQRTFMGSSLLEVPANLFGQIDAAPAEAVFAYTFANTSLRGIPSGMFGGVSGAPAVDMFWGTFSGTTFVSGYANISALFSGISGAPAKGMFDSTFYNSYNLSGNIPSNLFGGTGLLGVPAERMFASTFYGCYNLSGSIPANLFGGMGLTGASAVGMFDTTFFACIRLSGYVPMTLFGGISTSNPATNMMNHVFQYSGLLPACPCGTHDYTTGFESYWDGKVSCQIGLKPNEHWYGNICVEDCAAGITQIRTSTELSFQILKTKPTEHAIHISAPSDGTVCYVPLASGSAANSINVSLNGSVYHADTVSQTAPSGWDPLAQ